jgi:hypothetical protein
VNASASTIGALTKALRVSHTLSRLWQQPVLGWVEARAANRLWVAMVQGSKKDRAPGSRP